MKKKIYCLILLLMTSGVMLSRSVNIPFNDKLTFQFDDGEGPPVEDPTAPTIDNGEGPPVEDPPPPAPINKWIPVILVGGALLGYKTLKSKN